MSWVWEQADWPHFTWDAANLAVPLADASRAQGEVAAIAQLLNPETDISAHLEALTREGLASSEIEGERLDPHALRSSLARRLGVANEPVIAVPREVDGLAEVTLDAIQQHAESLTAKRLCAWQAALFPTGRSGLHAIRVGQFRGAEPMRIVSGPVGRERIHYEAPPHSGLKDEIKQFIGWYNKPPVGLDGLLRAGIAHAWFELIHPFEDGNGRVGRAVLDRALAQDENRALRLYSISAQLMAVRGDYYHQLEQLSVGGLDLTPWLHWFLTQYAAAVRASVTTVQHVVYRARFWMRHAHTTLNTRQRKALNALLDAGPGGYVGGMTNRKYAHLTRTSTASAQRDLAQLVEWGCLAQSGAGRGVRYELPV